MWALCGLDICVIDPLNSGGWDCGLQTRSPTTTCMALGLEWQNGHVEQGLFCSGAGPPGQLGRAVRPGRGLSPKEAVE